MSLRRLFACLVLIVLFTALSLGAIYVVDPPARSALETIARNATTKW